MNAVLILLGAFLVLTLVMLWCFLAMAGWSDRQLALAWRDWQELKSNADDDN